MSYFVFNGISSENMGIRIQSKSVYSAPKYDLSLTSIPGRDGDLISPNGRFSNITISYNCFLPAKSIEELAEKITKVKNWLYKEPDISDECMKIGVFTISFSCKPLRYLISGLAKQTYSSAVILTNEFSFTAKPYIKVNGKGAGTLTINNKIWHFETLNGYTECDSELMNYYHDTTLKNDKVTGDGFPTFEYGENHIEFSGGITSVEIIPRWVSL